MDFAESLPDSFSHSSRSSLRISINLMPSCKLDVPLSLTSITINDTFRQIARKNKFYRVEVLQNYAKVALRPNFNLRTLLNCCMQTKQQKEIT